MMLGKYQKALIHAWLVWERKGYHLDAVYARNKHARNSGQTYAVYLRLTDLVDKTELRMEIAYCTFDRTASAKVDEIDDYIQQRVEELKVSK